MNDILFNNESLINKYTEENSLIRKVFISINKNPNLELYSVSGYGGFMIFSKTSNSCIQLFNIAKKTVELHFLDNNKKPIKFKGEWFETKRSLKTSLNLIEDFFN